MKSKNNITYIAILSDNSLLRFDQLSWLKGKNHVKYIFKKELIETIKNTTFTGTPIEHYNYRYSLIDLEGNPKMLRVGKFELFNIDIDTRYFRTFTGRDISIYDLSNKTLRTFKSMTENEEFIVKELLPAFETLKLTNSWDIFTQLLELDALKIKYNKLKEENEKLKEKIKEYKKQSE